MNSALRPKWQYRKEFWGQHNEDEWDRLAVGLGLVARGEEFWDCEGDMEPIEFLSRPTTNTELLITVYGDRRSAVDLNTAYNKRDYAFFQLWLEDVLRQLLAEKHVGHRIKKAGRRA